MPLSYSIHTRILKSKRLEYGYDTPLKEYYYKLFNEDTGDMIDWQSTLFTKMTRSDLVKKLRAFSVEQTHIIAVLKNQPI